MANKIFLIRSSLILKKYTKVSLCLTRPIVQTSYQGRVYLRHGLMNLMSKSGIWKRKKKSYRNTLRILGTLMVANSQLKKLKILKNNKGILTLTSNLSWWTQQFQIELVGTTNQCIKTIYHLTSITRALICLILMRNKKLLSINEMLRKSSQDKCTLCLVQRRYFIRRQGQQLV